MCGLHNSKISLQALNQAKKISSMYRCKWLMLSLHLFTCELPVNYLWTSCDLPACWRIKVDSLYQTLIWSVKHSSFAIWHNTTTVVNNGSFNISKTWCKILHGTDWSDQHWREMIIRYVACFRRQIASITSTTQITIDRNQFSLAA